MEFCALKYGLPAAQAGSDSGAVILLAVKDANALRLYLHRAFQQQTTDRDLRYMNELLPDLVQRSKRAPEAAFRQLSQLSVGPLVTDEVGQRNFAADPVENLYPELELIGKKLPFQHQKAAVNG
jgi:hypothetical protein